MGATDLTMTQALGDSIAECEGECARLEEALAAATARIATLEGEIAALRTRVNEAEAAASAAAGALASERAARAEAENRCTFMVRELAKTDEEREPPAYDLVVTGRDSNLNILRASIMPKAK